jgi:hypothetical protein
MTTPPPLDTFSAELLPGETIEWTGQPNPSVIFHREDWLSIPFSLAWGGFALVWFLLAIGALHDGSGKDVSGSVVFPLFGSIFVLVGQYLIWGRFVYEWWRKKRTYYALTSRRALIVEEVFGRKTSSAILETMLLIEKRVRKDGIGIISFGGPVRTKFQFGSSHYQPKYPTFYDVNDADALHNMALRLQDRARRR